MKRQKLTPTPFFLIALSSLLVKCRPAVGAATAPSFWAETVWYLVLSKRPASLRIYGGRGKRPISAWPSFHPVGQTQRPYFWHQLRRTKTLLANSIVSPSLSRPGALSTHDIFSAQGLTRGSLPGRRSDACQETSRNTLVSFNTKRSPISKMKLYHRSAYAQCFLSPCLRPITSRHPCGCSELCN